ncbi:hypothetical protein D043_4457 [Vibrio parahaemolyticus EKP-021]|nr:hypothetical protein D043_4457 [Vibrio parahaemolyticus EKP-021]
MLPDDVDFALLDVQWGLEYIPVRENIINDRDFRFRLLQVTRNAALHMLKARQQFPLSHS